MDAIQMINSYAYWNNSNNNSGILPPSPEANEKETITPRSPDKYQIFKGRIMTKHAGSRRKYPAPTYYNIYEDLRDKQNSYSVTENYDHQAHNYGSEIYSSQNQEYEENYNTLPESPISNTNSNNNNNAYEGVITDPWRTSYIEQDPGYFGPPILSPPSNSIFKEPPPVEECHCPSTTRSYDCENTASNFMALVSALGQNLWALIRLIATSSLPFLIPLLAIKIIIIPLKIIKFLNFLKLFVKLFIILPFFIRVVFPAISNNFNLQDFFYQTLQDILPQASTPRPLLVHHHHRPHDLDLDDDDDAEGRHDTNLSSIIKKEDYYNDTTMWDLRSCPTRVTCELGAFLGGSTYTHFPTKLMDYLARKADRLEVGNNYENSGKIKDNDDEEEESYIDQSEAYKAFVVALGKKWTQEKCEIYKCPILY